MRYVLIMVLVLVGCEEKSADDRAATSGQTPGTGSGAKNTDAREALSGPQIASLLPGKAAGYNAQGVLRQQQLSVLYTDGNEKQIDLLVSDLIDNPEYHERHRESLQDDARERDLGARTVKFVSAKSEKVGGSWVWAGEEENGVRSVRSLLDDRFLVQMSSSTVPLEELEGFWKEHIRPALEGAPVHADAPAEGPDWLVKSGGGEADPSAGGTQTPTDVQEQPKLAKVPPCDELLPVAEIERICGVANVKAEPTDFEAEGNCNRVYRIEGERDYGMILLVSGFRDFKTAKQAFRASIDDQEEIEMLQNVGAQGARFRQLNKHILKFFARSALVEIKVSDNPIDTPDSKMKGCLEPDKLEELATGVAGRLAKAP